MEYINDNLTKCTGFYRCPDNIKHFKLRIRIRESQPAQNKKQEGLYIETEFLWQEKRFSKSQKQYYRDERNCYTDLEKEYHSSLISQPEEDPDGFLFSYINDEDYCPDSEVTDSVNYLQNGINTLYLGSLKTDENEYNFYTSLQKSMENPIIRTQWETMHIMADFGEYFEDAWIKNEKLLCTLKYNPDSKVLQVFPDFTTTHPYVLKIQAEEERVFSYFIENSSKDMPESIKDYEKNLIRRIHDFQASLKNKLITDTFKMPPQNQLYVFLFLEISSGRNFEYPEVFVQYSFQLPKGWNISKKEHLKGKTHMCRGNKDENLIHFGHCFEVTLEYNFMNLEHTEFPKSPCVYFEVISKDSWNRYRTEGLCYMNIPISQSGTFGYNLKCFRLTTGGPQGEMKRFFIGDCQNYDDVTWIGIPNDYQENSLNKYGTETICTGELNVRLSLMHQSQEFLEDGAENADRAKKIIFERLGSSTLIKSVEQVIQEFKKARKEMLEARKNV